MLAGVTPRLMIQLNEPKIHGSFTCKYTSVVVLNKVESTGIDLCNKNNDYNKREIEKKRKKIDQWFHTVVWSRHNVKIEKNQMDLRLQGSI